MTGTHTEMLPEIAAYRPRGFGGSAEEQARLEMMRAAVGAVGWSSAVQARKAAGHMWRYLSWIAASGTDHADAWSDETIEKYLQSRSDDPVGTRDAVSSFIGRVAAAQREPARPGVHEHADAASTPRADDDAAPSDGPLDELLTSYRPPGIVEQDWASLGPAVRKVVRCAGPRNDAELRALVGLVAEVGRWLVREHRPLRIDVILATATIEGWLASIEPTSPASTIRTYASVLHRAQERALPEEQSGSGVRKGRGREQFSGIYNNDDDVARQLRWARSRRSESARRQSHALLALGYGVGANGCEAGRVRPGDVSVEGNAVTVTLRDAAGAERQVHAAAAWARRLATVVRSAAKAGDRYLLGGRDDTDRTKRASALITHAHEHGVDIDLGKIHDTWLVHRCVEHDVVRLLAEAGVRTVSALIRVWPAVLAEAARR